MITFSTLAAAVAAGRVERFDIPAFTGYVDRLFQTPPNHPTPGPQAYRIRQDPGTVVPVHFHLEDEWQVVTRGSGTMGRHAMQPFLIHYASREAGYGPITSGDGGLDYMTLRPVTDPGMWVLPEHRGKMQPGLRKRQSTGYCDPQVLPPGMHDILATDENGILARCYRLEPGMPFPAGGDRFGADCFLVVATGSFVLGQDALPPLSCLFVPANDPVPDLRPAEPGSALLLLRFEPRVHAPA